jgi:predicted PurR-regulated permease PerM
VDLSSSKLFNSGPFRFGFVATLGVLLAVLLGLAVGSLGYVITLVFLALFVSLGLNPLVLKLESWKFSRPLAILTVVGALILVIALLLWQVIPAVTKEAIELLKNLPTGIAEIATQDWFVALNESVGGALLPLVQGLEDSLSEPALWIALGGGVLHVGLGLVNVVFGSIFVVALIVYFVASLESMKKGLYALAPASRRDGFAEIAEEIFASVGLYLNGMFVLAFLNSLFSFVLLTIVGVPYAGILAAIALPITFIPIVGSVISATVMTIVSLFTSPEAGLIVGLVMVVYLQVEANIMTPRIVGKAIQIPAALVLIGALVGATLLGLLGALVALPITAAILLIVKKVAVPAQNLR